MTACEEVPAMGRVYEGDIVLPDPGQKRGRNLFLDEDTVAEIVRKRVGMNRPLRELAEEYGVSHETIRNWSGEAINKRKRVDLDKVRARIDLELEAIKAAAWEIYLKYEHPKIKLDALTRIESALNGQTKLRGAAVPARLDVTLHEVTEAERELQEMIREAKAQTAATRDNVIAAATADETL